MRARRLSHLNMVGPVAMLNQSPNPPRGSGGRRDGRRRGRPVVLGRTVRRVRPAAKKPFGDAHSPHAPITPPSG
jgi:hypothetical protein